MNGTHGQVKMLGVIVWMDFLCRNLRKLISEYNNNSKSSMLFVLEMWMQQFGVFVPRMRKILVEEFSKYKMMIVVHNPPKLWPYNW